MVHSKELRSRSSRDKANDPDPAAARFGAMLRQVREELGLGLREVASPANVSPMYLSRLERGECGIPDDDKLQRLAKAVGEAHNELFFARAGRVDPRVVETVLQHPSEWTEFLDAAKDLRADQIRSLNSLVNQTPRAATALSLLNIISVAKSAQAKPKTYALESPPFAGMPQVRSAIEGLVHAKEALPSSEKGKPHSLGEKGIFNLGTAEYVGTGQTSEDPLQLRSSIADRLGEIKASTALPQQQGRQDSAEIPLSSSKMTSKRRNEDA